ncbi:trigger factor [Hominifimenecus sp. rT4P-3]|uniref:trigger factor n=1 Tax=Hominifimenecus sp. rT4P-3 TaxID=3242979 RepID=UPI003DA62997
MMKKGKKWSCLFLAASMTAALLTSCTKQTTPTETPEATSSVETTAAETSSAASTESTSAAAETTAAYQYSEGLTEDGFFENLRALDYVTLPSYQGIEIPADVHTITEEKIQTSIDTQLSAYAKAEQVTDRAVVDGDTVNIDYVGSIDGVEFEGGTTRGAGTSVTIGVTNYIDDFLEQLIGHKPGETIQVEVTFPENYGKEELNGKDAVFVTTINYIEGEMITPELTDDFVKENFQAQYGWNTADEMKEGIRSDLQKSAESEFIWNYLMENSTISEVPEAVLEYEKGQMIQYYTSNAAMYGVDLNTFLTTMMGVASVDELVEKSAEDLNNSAKRRMIVQAIAEDASLGVTEEDLILYFTENMGTADYRSYEEFYGEGYLKMILLNEQVTNLLIENAKRL